MAELPDEKQYRLAGMLMGKYVLGLEGKDLQKTAFVDTLKNASANVPYEFTATLDANLGIYVDDLLSRVLGVGDRVMSNADFDEHSYVALLLLRFAEKEGANMLSVHARRRLYANVPKGYTKEEVYAFFLKASDQLQEFMAPRSDDK